MTAHPHFERLALFASEDLKATERARTAAHVSSCADCSAAVKWVRDARAALRAAESPRAPAHVGSRVQARLESGDVVLLPRAEPLEARTSDHRARSRWIAAAALLLTAGALSAAIPGSPVRQWLEASISELLAPAPGTAPEPASTPDVTDAANERAHIALRVGAAAGVVTIDIEGPDPGLELRVRTADTHELELQASGAAAGARFSSGGGRLTIRRPGPGTVALVVPRQLPSAELRVDGRPYVVVNRGELRVLAPLADTAGSEIILRLRSAGEVTPRTR